MNCTSLNVSNYILIQLNFISKKFKISKKILISEVFRYCHHNLNYEQYISGLTKYQKKADCDIWKCLRINLSDTQCDIYFFYRNKFRISLSKLFAAGFVLFFDLIINDLSEKLKISPKVIKIIQNSYTDIKCKLIIYLQDTFKLFNLREEKG